MRLNQLAEVLASEYGDGERLMTEFVVRKDVDGYRITRLKTIPGSAVYRISDEPNG